MSRITKSLSFNSKASLSFITLIRLLKGLVCLTSLMCLACLTACSPPTTPTSASTLSSAATEKRLKHLKNFEARGKVGFSNGEKGGNATVRWIQRGQDYRIHLYGPFGAGSVEIVGRNGSVHLVRSDGSSVSAKTPEELVKNELGWVIPVSGLQYWLRGIPAQGSAPSNIVISNQTENQKELEQLTQQGWVVKYQSYQDVDSLRMPHRMVLTNGPIRLKFVFNQWQF